MTRAELVGGALLGCDDPAHASVRLAELLAAPHADRRKIVATGFDPDLVDALRRSLPADPKAVEQACLEGAAWVLGRRSLVSASSWELVASLPPGIPLPAGVARATGETIIHLATHSSRRLRVVAPFIDQAGVGFLTDALTAATKRGVSVEIGVAEGSTSAFSVLPRLEASVRSQGDLDRLRLVTIARDEGWAHLKVVTCDALAAYIGSANITGPGLGGRNFELGILVQGPEVAAIDALLDTIVGA